MFCASVSRQMCDMVNQLFVKNTKGKGNISWRDTWVTPSDSCDTAFKHISKKMRFKLFQLNRAKWIHFTERNCSTETARTHSFV